jgi:hypothetical protein
MIRRRLGGMQGRQSYFRATEERRSEALVVGRSERRAPGVEPGATHWIFERMGRKRSCAFFPIQCSPCAQPQDRGEGVVRSKARFTKGHPH